MAYPEITLPVEESRRAEAAGVYQQCEQLLDTIPGAVSKELLVRDEDVRVLHGLSTAGQARAYLDSDLFTKDVIAGQPPLLSADPEVRIHGTA